MAGTFHASTNAWPLLLLAGSSESFQQDMGAFQELDQVELLKPHLKYAISLLSMTCFGMMIEFTTATLRFAARPASLAQLPFAIEKAYRTAFYGRPGPSYIDLVSSVSPLYSARFMLNSNCA